MSDSVLIRPATMLDAQATLDIYSPNILESSISFEETAPSIEEWEQRIAKVLKKFPWLVLTVNDVIAGYAYACEHRSRPSYQWSVESSVYFARQFCRRGFARKILTALYAILVHQGFYNVYAGVTLPNEGSVKLHESLGFEPVGVFRQVGFKRSTWHDVAWWQRPLQPLTVSPETPSNYSDLSAKEIVETIGSLEAP